MTGWPTLETVVEYETGWFTAGYDRVERPNGETARYYWIEPADAAVIVAVDGDDLLLVEQYRPRQGTSMVTLPAGMVEADESYAAAARRELREETGYRAGEIELLETYQPSGWLRMRHAVARATDLTPGEQALDDGEYIEVRRWPVDGAIERAREGVAFGPTLAALLLADHEDAL